MSTELNRLSELAKADKTTRFLSLAHRLTPAGLLADFDGLRKDASAGVDEVTYREYEQDVWRNIPALHDRPERTNVWSGPAQIFGSSPISSTISARTVPVVVSRRRISERGSICSITSRASAMLGISSAAAPASLAALSRNS